MSFQITRVSGLLDDGVEYKNHLRGFLVASSTKNRIKSEKKRRPPAKLPTLAITSARSLSLSCNGVLSESRRKAISQSCQLAPNEGGTKDEPIMIRPLKLFVPTEMTVIYGPDADDDKDSNKDGDALDPIYWWFPSGASLAEVSEEAEHE